MLLKKEEVIKMFQIKNETENTKEKMAKTKNIFANVISKKYLILYIVTFMISQVPMGFDTSPFVFAMIGACIANEIPIIAITILGIIGNSFGTGLNGSLTLIVTLLIFFASFFVKEPAYNNSTKNEKILLSKRIFFTSLIINIAKIFLNQVLIYDILVAISYSILTVIFYKIFANSVKVLTSYNDKMVFSIEEVLGASLLLSIALCCLGNFAIFGFSVRNVLSIFIVLVLGWKNGILVGTTAGVTIGVTLGIIADNEPVVVAAYAISGMIAGILNKFGKFGVVSGFVIGNIVLSYITNGLVNHLILFKEILIAGVGLIAIPKNINLNIEKIIGENKFLPTNTTKRLNKSNETVQKLNNVSKAVGDIAATYENVAATRIDEEDIIENNKQVFINELLNSLENLKENILYDSINNLDNSIIDEIFNHLEEKKFIKEEELIKILENNNYYIIGFKEKDEKVKNDVEKMTSNINTAYRISKINFIYTEKLKEKKENFKSQLKGVSKAISNLADDIEQETESEENYLKEKEQITILLKQKDIIVQDISITKIDRYKIDLYIEEEQANEKIILNIITKVLNEKVTLIQRKKVQNEISTKYEFISSDKYNISVGHSIAIKDSMPVSGDCLLEARLKDGKYLIAISDGMGSRTRSKEK